MSWEGLNRRRFPRAKFPCLVKIMINGSAVDAILAHTENISTGGVCVILKKGLERFSAVDIEIDLLDAEDHIACRGKVVWSVRRKATDPLKPSCYDTGIEYVDIKNEVRQRIERVVEYIVKNENKAKL